jgi:hypothetical protein
MGIVSVHGTMCKIFLLTDIRYKQGEPNIISSLCPGSEQ